MKITSESMLTPACLPIHGSELEERKGDQADDTRRGHKDRLRDLNRHSTARLMSATAAVGTS